MINWQYYPKYSSAPEHLMKIIAVFEQYYGQIKSPDKKLKSNQVLDIIKDSLDTLGFMVESGKKSDERIRVPVLFGRNGKVEKSFDADAYNSSTKTVLEVEAGRAVMNYQFLKDLFEACMMQDVSYAVIAVNNGYKTQNKIHKDYVTIEAFFDTLFASRRLILPLEGVLVIGY